MCEHGNVKFYLVGGCVRDEILGHRCNDIDYAVEAQSFEHMKRSLSNHQIYVEKPEFGTIKAKCPDTKVVADYTLCRRDGYYADHRRPDSIEVADIHADLSRRDFTINAIAKLVHPDGSSEYFDPYNGSEDLSRKLIRCVGSAKDRLTEDPLRGLRALRFSITKGFTIDLDILKTMETPEFITAFKTLAIERIHVELSKMFKHDTLASMKLLAGLSAEFQRVIFREGLWLCPSLKSF
jgi:tRNA nucleotidyltransferase (CCA-adding enzyme)